MFWAATVALSLTCYPARYFSGPSLVHIFLLHTRYLLLTLHIILTEWFLGGLISLHYRQFSLECFFEISRSSPWTWSQYFLDWCCNSKTFSRLKSNVRLQYGMFQNWIMMAGCPWLFIINVIQCVLSIPPSVSFNIFGPCHCTRLAV